MVKPPRESAIILSGGGAYAAYEVGVMRALLGGHSPSTEFKPLRPTVIAGTSSGAFNAALLTSSSADLTCGAEQVADIWLDRIADQGLGCGNGVFRYRGDPFRGLGEYCTFRKRRPLSRLASDGVNLTENLIRRGAYFFSAQADLDQRLVELVDLSAFISTEPFAHTIQRSIYLDRIRSSSTKLLVAATNWKTGDLRIFRNGDFTDETGHDIVRASTAVPGLFDSVEIDGDPYVDGGVVQNTPLKPAIDAGASTLHIVYINPNIVRIPLPRVRNTMAELFRALITSLANSANRDIELAAQVNLGIHVLRHPETLSTSSELKALITKLSGMVRHFEPGGTTYRQLTIHRYYPQEMYGGLFKWLSFGRDHLLALMQRGFADALAHDCKINGCVLAIKDTSPSLRGAE